MSENLNVRINIEERDSALDGQLQRKIQQLQGKLRELGEEGSSSARKMSSGFEDANRSTDLLNSGMQRIGQTIMTVFSVEAVRRFFTAIKEEQERMAAAATSRGVTSSNVLARTGDIGDPRIAAQLERSLVASDEDSLLNFKQVAGMFETGRGVMPGTGGAIRSSSMTRLASRRLEMLDDDAARNSIMEFAMTQVSADGSISDEEALSRATYRYGRAGKGAGQLVGAMRDVRTSGLIEGMEGEGFNLAADLATSAASQNQSTEFLKKLPMVARDFRNRMVTETLPNGQRVESPAIPSIYGKSEADAYRMLMTGQVPLEEMRQGRVLENEQLSAYRLAIKGLPDVTGGYTGVGYLDQFEAGLNRGPMAEARKTELAVANSRENQMRREEERQARELAARNVRRLGAEMEIDPRYPLTRRFAGTVAAADEWATQQNIPGGQTFDNVLRGMQGFGSTRTQGGALAGAQIDDEYGPDQQRRYGRMAAGLDAPAAAPNVNVTVNVAEDGSVFSDVN